MNNTKKDTLELGFTLTQKEFGKGLFLGNKKGYFLIGFLIILFLSSYDAYYIDAPNWPLELLKSAISSGLSYVLLLLFFRWLIPKLSFKKHKTCSDPISYKFSEEGVDISHALGHTALKWKAFDKYIWIKDLCIIFIGRSRHIIPLRVLNTDEKEFFKQILSQYIKTNS